MINVIAIAQEVDLLPGLLPNIPMNVAILQEKSKMSKVVHVKTNLMWPLSNRELIINGQGFDMLDHAGIVMIVMQGEDSVGPDVPIPKNGDRALLHLGGCIIRPIDRNRTAFDSVMNVLSFVFIDAIAG